MTSSTEPKLYRIKDTIFRIYAVEEGDHVIWTKFHEDYVQLKDMRRDTIQEFEILRTHMGYEEETDTKFTVAGDRLYLRK
jgi:nitric oxide reductase activation protein